MIRTFLLLGLLASVAACGDGQPFFDGDPDGDGSGDGGDGGGDGDGDDGVGGDGDLPPGTESPSAESGIFRYEADDGEGGGYVRDVRYNAESDTFFVDNLAFDGDNVYSRDDDVGTLSDPSSATVYAVYEGDDVETDPSDGDEVDQFQYRAIYGASQNETEDGEPRTQFAIVRTGQYVDYGFGGFVYERTGGVDLPTEGQASYAGDYAGIRTFEGRTGLEYTTGEIEIAIDFRDFNEGEGVQGVIRDRAAFEEDGDPVSDALPLPNLTFDVGPGTVTANGEMSNGVRSYTVDEAGALEEYEAGTYYAIVAGDNAEEIVGVIVIESQDPRYGEDDDGPDVTAQETGGFIVYR
jgi:hypothetical protein